MSAREASIPDLVAQTTAFALILFSGLAPMTAEPANTRPQLSVIVPNRFMKRAPWYEYGLEARPQNETYSKADWGLGSIA